MNSPTQRRIDEIGDESRRRILDAAEELFAEKGFERTSFVDISTRSGISRGSIPWHFKNKDGLVLAVVERSVKRAMPTERYTAPPSFGTVVSDYVRYLQEGSPRMLFMVLTEALKSTGSLNEQYRNFMHQRRADLQLWFRAQRPEGVDRATAVEREQSLATVVNAAMIGIQLQWQIDPEGVDLNKSMEVLAALVDGQVDQVWAKDDPAEKASSEKSAT